MSVEISIHKPEDLSTERLYALLKLRTHVFIVEQTVLLTRIWMVWTSFKEPCTWAHGRTATYCAPYEFLIFTVKTRISAVLLRRRKHGVEDWPER